MPTLLTGASGFLGQILADQLQHDGPLATLGRSATNTQQIDLTTGVPDLPAYTAVVHNAGWAHRVPRTEVEARQFWQVNHEGTANLLQALAPAPPQAMVLISTVAVYGREEGQQLPESTPIEATTPYAASKYAAEQLWHTWATERHIDYLILRLPLVAGPDPPGNLGAMTRAIRGGYYPLIRGNEARKSIVRADDVALLISQWLQQTARPSGTYHLTDGHDPAFNDIAAAIARGLHRPLRLQLPDWLFRIAGRVGDVLAKAGLPAPLTTDTCQKMASTLTFSTHKAQKELNWQPRSATTYLAGE